MDNQLIFEEPPIEPERYELTEEPRYRFEVSRRDFCRTLGGGLLVLLVLPSTGVGQELQSGRPGRLAQDGGVPEEVGGWIHIAEDGVVTGYTGKVEVGQKIRTSLAQAISDELRVPMESVKMVMGDTGLTPFDRGTFGSLTTPQMAPQMRRAAAGAREALTDMAAKEWGVPRGEVELRDGQLHHSASGRSSTFGAMTAGKELTARVGAQDATMPRDQWVNAGKSAPAVNGRALVTGTHKYPSDISLPGMVHGAVVRPSTFEAELVSVDATEAEKMPGVKVVRDGNFVGVTAPNPEAARRAAGAIKAEWKAELQPSGAELFDYLKKNTTERSGRHTRSRDETGSIEDGLRDSDTKLEGAYTVAYIAHVPLEPRAAVAEWKNGQLTVWTGTQRPFGVRTELAQAFSIPEEKIRVVMPDTGSGYGGKHTGDAAIEAARLAKGAGKPVKVVWSREEEFTWAYFRPAGVIEIRSGANRDGKLTTWEHRNWNSGPGGIRSPYASPNRRTEFIPTKSPLRQGSYRALAATANHFAREVHMDELALALGIDPLEFRMNNLAEDRVRAVLQQAADAFGWGRGTRQDGRGYGLACGLEKGGFVATCAEIEMTGPDKREIRVVRATTAFECGAVVNPDHLRNQIEGAVIQGLGGALFEAVRFENGRILNPGLKQYRVPRFSDMPVLETIPVDQKDLPSAGAGETPIVAIAPAIANAVFSATGKRLRSLPLQGAL